MDGLGRWFVKRGLIKAVFWKCELNVVSNGSSVRRILGAVERAGVAPQTQWLLTRGAAAQALGNLGITQPLERS